MSLAYIGMGANLDSPAGTPAATLAAALVALRRLGEVIRFSSLYKTLPVGNLEQPPFINAVTVLRTEATPENLLHHLLQIEREFGRDRSAVAAKGPRTLDLDLLLFDDLVLDTALLSLPHPALAERRFVLAPLAEIAAEVVHPVLRKTIRELLRQLPNAGTNRAEAVRPVGDNPLK